MYVYGVGKPNARRVVVLYGLFVSESPFAFPQVLLRLLYKYGAMYKEK